MKERSSGKRAVDLFVRLIEDIRVGVVRKFAENGITEVSVE
jgi:hypothetical protein